MPVHSQVKPKAPLIRQKEAAHKKRQTDAREDPPARATNRHKKGREEGQGIGSDIPRDYKFLTGEIATRT